MGLWAVPSRRVPTYLTMLSSQRISRIQSTLSSDLDHLFSNNVTMLSTGKLADIDKAKRLADLTECLRTYDALQLWRDAEDVLRRHVLREFVKKVTYT
jgi:conserved oligomeric Golgi complex subunit 2